jgi:hypothetical protein
VLGAASATAHAATKNVEGVIGESGSGPGQFTTVAGLAVRQSTGDTYVVDRSGNRISQFDSSGLFVRAFGADVGGAGVNVCTTTCQAGTSGPAAGQMAAPQGIAIDEATGNLYVTDQTNRRVDVFDSAGTFEGAWGFGVVNGTAALQFCTTTCQQGLSGAGAGQFGTSIGYPAVAPASAGATAGHIYVADPTNRRVQEFTPTLTGSTVTSIAFAGAVGASGTGNGQFSSSSSSPSRVAVDSTGSFYVVDAGNNRIQKFTSARAFSSVYNPGGLVSGALAPSDVAVDTTNGDHVYVVKPNGTSGLQPRKVLEFDSLNTLVDTHMLSAGITSAPTGLAINSTTTKIYIASGAGGQQRVLVLNTVAAPTASGVSTANVTVHTAQFNAIVNPNGPNTPIGVNTGYHFEYKRSADSTWTSFPAPDVDVGEGTTSLVVSQGVSGLEAGISYDLRLVAAKPFGSGTTTTTPVSFSTSPSTPDVVAFKPTRVSANGVELDGTVNPNNLATTYYFEYGTGRAPDSKVPVASASAGPGGSAITVSRQLDGLLPETTYRFRLVAENAQGEAQTDYLAFTTPAVAGPRGRVYEMVTAPDKIGRRQQFIGPDGRNASTALPSADGDSLISGLYSSNLSDGFAFTFDFSRSVRTGDGWTTQSVARDVRPFTNGQIATLALSGLSDDLLSQAWISSIPLYADQLEYVGVAKPTYTQLADGSYPVKWTTSRSQMVGTSSGGDRALFAGDLMVRWGTYRGLAASDSSPAGQLPGDAGGQTVYRERLDEGRSSLELVSSCTGTGASATRIPSLTSTTPAKMSSQPCSAGSVISSRGAVVGGGGGGSSVDDLLTGPSVTAASRDGARLFLESPDPRAQGLPTACSGSDSTTSCGPQLYVRQQHPDGSESVRWISRSAVPNQDAALAGPGVAFDGASSDGSTVFFHTPAALTADDPNGGAQVPGGVTSGTASLTSTDLYEYDLPSDPSADPATGTLTRITAGPSGAADPNVSCGRISAGTCTPGLSATVARYISDDGTKVYFVTASPIAGVAAPSDGTTTAPGGTVRNASTRNLYLYDSTKSGAGRWEFLAQLPLGTVGDDVKGCASAFGSPGRALSVVSGASVLLRPISDNCVHGSPNGQQIVFMTPAQLTPDDTDAAVDVYTFNEISDRLTRVSVQGGGVAGMPYPCSITGTGSSLLTCNGDLGVDPVGLTSDTPRGVDGLRHESVTDDGMVFFESRQQLVAADVNDRMDTYAWRDGTLSLISPGTTADDAYYSGNSIDGRDVFFETSQGIDGDREIDPADFDIYDARVGGGFPKQQRATACDVHADACQQRGQSASAGATPTATAEATGDATPAPRGQITARKLSKAQLAKLAGGRKVNLQVTVNVPGKVSVKGAASVTRRTARRLHGKRVTKVVKRTVTVISARAGATRAQTLSLLISLSKTGRTELVKARKLSVRLTIAFSSSREPVTATIGLSSKRTTTTKKGGAS